MGVICISRQMGTHGSVIAAKVAEELGYRYIDGQITDWISSRSGLPEELLMRWDERGPRGFVDRLLDRAFLTHYGMDWGLYGTGGYHDGVVQARLSEMANATYREELPALIEDLGNAGFVVTVGRGAGFLLLDKVPDLLHVRLIASEEQRATVLVERMGLSPDCALALVRRSADQRRKFILDLCQADWDDLKAYDAVINTGLIGVDGAKDLIVGMAKRRQRFPVVGETAG
ncbi:MAG: cytidylate kinase-like family protein [Chloroflexota bacterium]|nr:cytidylate kinase-like family protein [Chloroflexota bacterium]